MVLNNVKHNIRAPAIEKYMHLSLQSMIKNVCRHFEIMQFSWHLAPLLLWYVPHAIFPPLTSHKSILEYSL